MRDINKLKYIHRKAVGNTKGHKATGYKEHLMNLISHMPKKRRLTESMDMVTKYVKSSPMKEGLD